MSGSNDTAATALVFDASGAVAGAAAFKAAADKIIAANNAVDATFATATKRVVESSTSQTRMLNNLARSYDPLGAAVRKYQNDIEKLQDVAAQGGPRSSEAALLLTAAQTKLAQAQRTVGETSTETAIASGNAAFAQRQLGVQTVQLLSSIQAGTPILTAFIQQGHQIVDVSLATGTGFGVLGQAAKTAFGYLISPVGLAVAGLAAVGAAAYVVTNRIVTLQGETRSLNATIAAAGRTADLSAGQLVKYITELERAGVDREEGTSIIGALTRNPMLTQQQQGKIATLAPDVAAFLGTKAPEAAKLIETAFAGGYDAVKKLDEALNFLNPDQRTAIRQALEHGDRVTALGIEVDALDAKFQGFVRAGMSDMDKKLRDLRNRWIDLKDAATEGWGASDMSFTQIAAAAAGGFRGATLLGGGLGSGANPPGLNDLLPPGMLPPGATMPDLGGGAGAGGARRDRAPSVGSPVPGGAAADAQRKRVEDMTEAFRNQQRVLEAGLPAREVLRATIEAENKARDLGLTGAARETYITQAVAAARMQAGDAAAQELAVEQRQIAAGGLWVDTLDRGRSGLITVQAALEAHEKAATQAGVSELALAQAILNRKAADEAAKGAGAFLDLKDRLTDLQQLGDAQAFDSKSTHMTEVRLQAEAATRAMKAYREAATDPAVRDALTGVIDRVRGITFEVDAAANRSQNLNDILTQKDQLTILAKQGELIGTNATETARQVAQLQMLLDLERQQGADPAHLTDEQQKRIALAGAIAAGTVQLQTQRGVLNDITGMFTSSFDTIGNAMTQAFMGGSGAAVNWKNVMTSVSQQVLQQFMKLAVLNPLLNAIFPGSDHRTDIFDAYGALHKVTPGSTTTSGSGGGGFIGTLLSLGARIFGGGSALGALGDGVSTAGTTIGQTVPLSAADDFATFTGRRYHAGGIVGVDGVPRLLPGSAWEGAPRYHAGLGANEFAAILEGGERVLTGRQQKQVAAAAGSGGPTVNNFSFHGVTDFDSFKRSQSQTASIAVNMLAKSRARFGS